jgi:hypothetical protein
MEENKSAIHTPCLREVPPCGTKAGEIRNGLPFFPLIRKSFVNQHHGDIVSNRIEQVAGFADKAISFVIQENISLTFRASQNLQKLFTDRHFHSPFLFLSYDKFISHGGSK